MNINYIENLSPVISNELAEELSQFSGDWITLNKEVKIDEDAFNILSNYNGRIFSNIDKYEWEDFEIQNNVRKKGNSQKISKQLRSLGINQLFLNFYGHYDWQLLDYFFYKKQHDQKIDISPIINNIVALTFPGPDKLAASKHAESYVVIKLNTEKEYGMLYHHYSYEFQHEDIYYLLILSFLEDIKVAEVNLILKQLDVSKGFEIDYCNEKNTTLQNNVLFISCIQEYLNRAVLTPCTDPVSDSDMDIEPSYSNDSLKVKNVTRYETSNLNICLDSKSFIFSNSKGSVTVSINEPLKEAAKIYL